MGAQPLLAESQPVFAVDLDDSLLKTDLLLEKLVAVVVKSPLNLLKVPVKLFQGKLAFKKWLNQTACLDYSSLPIRTEVLEKVKDARNRGERTLLISASLQDEVSKCSQLVPFFDILVGTENDNLKGAKKLTYLKSNYPNSHLTYVGDSFSDLKVWEGCHKIIAVNPSPLLNWKIKSKKMPTEYVVDPSTKLSFVLQQMRVHHWAKNILVFLPVFAAHKFLELGPWARAFQAFLSFSFLASSVYVFNDICDLTSDRKQSSKKHRPLASGVFSLKSALLLVPVCLSVSVIASIGIGLNFRYMLAAYLLMNVVYSFWIKQVLVMDVVFLAGFYTLRIFAGGAASNIPVSEWLLSFSVFFFFGLAMLKRYSELKAQPAMDPKIIVGRRAYHSQDLIAVLVSGVSTSILSILVLALYMSTGEVAHLYRKPQLLWFVTPCLLFWLNRLWILGGRGLVSEDPLIFALKDKVTWGVVLGVLFLMLKAI